jgi:hypothetical protein
MGLVVCRPFMPFFPYKIWKKVSVLSRGFSIALERVMFLLFKWIVEYIEVVFVGRYFAMSLNIFHLQSQNGHVENAIPSPYLVTWTISFIASCRCDVANTCPKLDRTTSKISSSNGWFSAFASLRRMTPTSATDAVLLIEPRARV